MYTKLLHKTHVYIKLRQLWLHQIFNVVCCCCCLDVFFFVLWLILFFNMFYKTIKTIRIKYLKSRKFFASWVFVPLKMAIMAFCMFFRPRTTINCHRMYTMHQFFSSWNSVILGFGGHICKLLSFEDFCCALINFFPKTFFFFMSITSKSDNWRYEKSN